MGKVILNGIRVYAFHGCMEEEELIGSDYIVNLEVETDMQKPTDSDLLEDAVDYVQLNAVVKEEMLIRSRLLEHIAKRIIDRILKQFPMVKNVEVKVAKQTPPIGGDVREVCVCIKGLNTKG